MKEIFHKIAATGHASWSVRPWRLSAPSLWSVAWAAAGPYFGYSDTWQLVINTGTTVLTFLIIFLVQNTQNRDAHAMNLKLDELIRAMKGARISCWILRIFPMKEWKNFKFSFKNCVKSQSFCIKRKRKSIRHAVGCLVFPIELKKRRAEAGLFFIPNCSHAIPGAILFPYCFYPLNEKHMRIVNHVIKLTTSTTLDFIDITARVQRKIKASGIKNGIINIQSPATPPNGRQSVLRPSTASLLWI